MRGTVVQRSRRCGRANCACAKDPAARHPGKYLSVHVEGRTQVVHLRPVDQSRVEQAVEVYRELWEIINGLTLCELADLRREVRERRRSRRGRQDA